MLRPATTLDAAMTVQQALRHLALHGYWLDVNHPAARERIQAYIDHVKRVTTRPRSGMSAVGARHESHERAWRAEVDAAKERPRPDPTNVTVDEAAAILAQPVEDAQVAIFRQDGVTVFWYARPMKYVLTTLMGWGQDDRVVDALNLHEYTADPTTQATSVDAAQLDRFQGVVLHDLQPVAIGDSTQSPYDWAKGSDMRGGEFGVAPGTSSPAPAPTDPGTTVRAHPYLHADNTVAVGDPFPLTIGLSDDVVPGVESAGPVVLHVPVGARLIPVEVHVIADGFDSANGWRHTMLVDVQNPMASRVVVHLVARPQNEDIRLTRLIVHYVVDSVVCGSAARNIAVERFRGIAPSPDPRGTAWEAAQPPIAPLTIVASPAQPDVELDIAKPNANPVEGQYVCVMRNAHGVAVPDQPLPVLLGKEAKVFAKEIIDDMQRWSGDPLLDNMVESTAATITDKLPHEFWTMLRSVAARVGNRPLTLQINSAEPYVPWELALVDPPLDPTRPKFLAAQVVAGRWILGASTVPAPPVDTVNVKAMAVMAGMYSGATGLRPLPNAQAEVKALATSYAALPAVLLDCTSANLKLLFDAKLVTPMLDPVGGAQAVHFAGHGHVNPNRPSDAAFYLSNAMPLSPRFFRRSTLGSAHAPFMFLNACMVGTAGEVLGDYGGFPGEALAGGFTALVAPLWAVNDEIAKSIAIDFYQKALDQTNPIPVAEILRDMRANYQSDKPVSSYLAYVFYGNPRLTLKRA